MKTARQVAVEGLAQVNEDGGYSQIVLDHLLKGSGLDRRDKGFATAIFYGTLERQLTLDYDIAPYVQHKLKPVVREILRTAVYQLRFMPSVPQNAVVNEAVELTKKMRQPGASKMVNGILRSYIRNGQRETDSLSILYSCPQELIDAFTAWYGEEKTKGILEASLGQPQTFVRVNTLKTTAEALIEQFKAEGKELYTTSVDNCLMGEAGELLASPLHQEGCYHIQDMSSQMAVLAVGAKSGERILDVCAAPGSKSFSLGEEMNNMGQVVSCDIYQHKIDIMMKSAGRLGLMNIKGLINDGTKLNAELGSFDRILCDVPCSGLGIIRRKPEIKYKTLDSFKSLPEYQYNILETATNYLKVGGRLVYSTCTINPKENQKVVEKFLATHPNFCLGDEGMNTMLPNSTHGDGFFIAVMRRVQ